MSKIFPVIILMIAASGSVCAGAEARALWVWETAKLINGEDGTAKFFRFCKSKKISTVFLYSGKELFNNEDNHAAIKKLLKKAHAAGIEVHALDGWPKAVYKENHKEFLASLENIIAFNADAEKNERFDGFQADVEPYNLPEFKASAAGRKKIESLFVELLEKCRGIIDDEAKGTFKLGLAISERYSHEHSDVPEKMLEAADYLAVMAYRNKAERIISSAEYFIEAAFDVEKKVWIGVETGNPGNEPASISFYGKSIREMEEELGKVSEEFKDKKSFSGIAIHSYKSYAEMNLEN